MPNMQLVAFRFTVPAGVSWNIQSVVLGSGTSPGNPSCNIVFFYDSTDGNGNPIPSSTKVSRSDDYNSCSCTWDSPGLSICTFWLPAYGAFKSLTLPAGNYWFSLATDANDPTWVVSPSNSQGVTASPVAVWCGDELWRCQNPSFHNQPQNTWIASNALGWNVAAAYPVFEMTGYVISPSNRREVPGGPEAPEVLEVSEPRILLQNGMDLAPTDVEN